ncbi:MAG: undecaprenyl-phosphate glucose phosphotransferase [Candidatus Parabeggiatoa sp. nov. 3]|nr:MAG: undecaprenyl-phosphate glucose phosphotransferase [Gammaproteobacteria bacterium]
MPNNSSSLIKTVDILSIIISGIIVYIAYLGFEELPIPLYYSTAIVLGVLLSLVIFPWFGVHKLEEYNFFPSVHKLIFAWITVIAVLNLLGFGLKVSTGFSRVWMVGWTILGSAMLVFMRLAVHHSVYLINKQGRHLNKIVIIGAQQLGQTLVRNIKASKPYINVDVVAFFDDETQQDNTVENIPVNNNMSALPTFVKENEISEVWVTPQSINSSCLETILHQLRHNLVTVRFVANFFSFRMINASITNRYGLPVITLTESPMTKRRNRLIKTIEDKILATLILLVISPLMLVVAIGVKLSSPGPILFRQERVGWNGEPFIMLKFRSMPVNVEKDSGPVWAKGGENRATRFGSFLRKTSLDELPQFLNVLKGEMSIVGPRPERPCFVEQFKDEIPDYMQKHLVKAGITGWAQVKGWRGNTGLPQRIEHDIYYIENWSVWFDIQIILMTIVTGFFDNNAY